MSAIARLAKLKLRRFKPKDDYKPVRSPGPSLCVGIVAGLHGRRRKNESVLAAYARALGVSVPKLWRLVYFKPDRWWQMHKSVDSCPYSQAEMREAVVRQFLVEEATHQLIEAAIEESGGQGGWLDRVMGSKPWPGLCRVRPLKPLEMSNSC
jgi:hypothetical protein